MNIYVEREKVYVKNFREGKVPLYVKMASKSEEQSETGPQKWVYTLAKDLTPKAEVLDEIFAEEDLSNEPLEQGYVQVLPSEVLDLKERLDRDGT